jgi:hypothetical protein
MKALLVTGKGRSEPFKRGFAEPKRDWEEEMKAAKSQPTTMYLSPQITALLAELGEECQNVLKLLAQLELPDLQEEQVEALIGELSAAIVHLHAHTQGLDELLDESGSR